MNNMMRQFWVGALMIGLVTISFAEAVVAAGPKIFLKASNNQAKYAEFKASLLGKWLYVDDNKIKGTIEFYDDYFVLLTPGLIGHDSHPHKDESVLAFWSDIAHVTHPTASPPKKNHYGAYLDRFHIVETRAVFVNSELSTGKETKADLYKPYTFAVSEPLNGKLKLFAHRQYKGSKHKMEVKTLIGIELLKKTNPDLVESWISKQRVATNKQEIQRLNEKCHTEWGFPNVRHNECKKYITKYKDIGFTPAKLNNLVTSTPQVSKFLIEPVTDDSDFTFPPQDLSYESYFSTCRGGEKAFHQKLAVNKFKDTLWMLTFKLNPKTTIGYKNPREYKIFQSVIEGWNKYRSTQLLHLRKDGVFGITWIRPDLDVREAKPNHLNVIYDSANRWQYDGVNIVLNWQNGTGEYKFNITKNYLSADAVAFYETAHIELIENRFKLYGMMDWHGFYPKLIKESKWVAQNKKLKKMGIADARKLSKMDLSACKKKVVKKTAGHVQYFEPEIIPYVGQIQEAERKDYKSIAINNSGFEDDVLASNKEKDSWHFGLKGWKNYRGGVVNPHDGMYANGQAPEGNNIAFVSKSGASISQVLNENLAANRTYELRVLVGNRADSDFTKCSISMSAGGLSAAKSQSCSVDKGEFKEIVARYTSAYNIGKIDKPLEIRLEIESGNQVNFDNVRLASWAFGAGGSEPVISKKNIPAPIKSSASPVVRPAPVTKRHSPAPVIKPVPVLTQPVVTPVVTYWYARIVLVDPNMPIDPTIKALWNKGAYLHFRQDGQLGFNWNIPGAYGYDKNNRWSRTGSTIVITMGDISYTFDASTKAKTHTTVDNNTGVFSMRIKEKSAGQK